MRVLALGLTICALAAGCASSPDEPDTDMLATEACERYAEHLAGSRDILGSTDPVQRIGDRRGVDQASVQAAVDAACPTDRADYFTARAAAQAEDICGRYEDGLRLSKSDIDRGQAALIVAVGAHERLSSEDHEAVAALCPNSHLEAVAAVDAEAENRAARRSQAAEDRARQAAQEAAQVERAIPDFRAEWDRSSSEEKLWLCGRSRSELQRIAADGAANAAGYGPASGDVLTKAFMHVVDEGCGRRP